MQCAEALVVGMTVWLPDDPHERFIGMPDWIGCNRLFCSGCNSWVKHLDHVGFRADGPPAADIAPLYDDAHAESYAGFSRARLSHRVYLCRCECTEVAGVRRTCMSDTIDCWRCAGHPAPSAPEVEAPVQPTTDAEVKAMLRSSARDPEGWDFALRWRPPFVFRSVWPVVSDFLVDRDPVVRARALELVGAWKIGTAATFDRLLDLAVNHSSLFTEQALRAQLVSILSRNALAFPIYSATITEAIDGLAR